MKMPAKLPLVTSLNFNAGEVWLQDFVASRSDKVPAEAGKLYLYLDQEGLSLRESESKLALKIDFLSGESAFKQRKGVGKESLLGRALGLKHKNQTIFDATAGVGGDLWMFLLLGLQVRASESSPTVYALLRDAIQRAQQDALTRHFDAESCSLFYGDCRQFLSPDERTDIVYLDFMFAAARKALPKKSMQLLQRLELQQEDEEEIAKLALQCTNNRLVIKRALKARSVLPNPHHSFRGSSIRYDVYFPPSR